MLTIRNDFMLTSRNDLFVVRVKRINSVDNWIYNTEYSRTNIISSVPESPPNPPFINA